MQSPKNVLLNNKDTACGHTRGCFVPQLMGTWLPVIPARIQLSKLYWTAEKRAKRNASVLRTQSRSHARTCREQSPGPFQWKDLYVDVKNWGLFVEPVAANEPHPRAQGDRF